MTEPIHPPPEMFTATRYMVFTTFWAFVLPGAIIHGLPLLLTGIFSLDPIALGGVAVCVVFLYGGIRFLKRLSDCHRTGNGPRSFIVRILPFWIPLFWGLTMSAIGFFVGPLSLLAFQGCMLGSFPHFFIPFAFCLIIGGALFMVIAGSTINFLLAIIGTIYISLLAPPIPKKRSLVLCIAITLLLCWLAGLSYHHFRTKMLPPFSLKKIHNTNPHVPKLTDWFLSPQGQELIENVGYVPMESVIVPICFFNTGITQ